ncbi:CidA/LrgA family protein [Telmatobacter bradus]|uniref:CidA/LrgA family protein n=1 Tax=Telmatobacter bradus TaxID=474953 RepID=UPI003B434340
MLDYLRGFALLTGFLFLGQGTHRLGSPIPGSVAGLLLLVLAMTFKLVKLQWVEKTATLLLHHMVLLFVPVTVGLMEVGPVLKQSGLAIAASLIVSLLAVLATVGLLSRWLLPYDAHSELNVGPAMLQDIKERQ